MPAISSGKVLVTGANGFIAVWIVKLLLDAGFSVKGAVRAESKATYLRRLFQPFGDKFEIAIVPDMTKEDAFAPHVTDVDAIVHTASPVLMIAGEPDEIIVPAVAGTLSVLKAAQAHGANVKRIVILSSTAAVGSSTKDRAVFDESAWNEKSLTEVREKGRDASAMDKYCASKTLAERGAREWCAEHQGEVGWDLTVLNPPYVFGPPLHEVVGGAENLNASMLEWYDTVVKGTKRNNEALMNDAVPWVDVRDMAQAHVLALQKPGAGGERFIIGADECRWQGLVSAAHRLSDRIPAGNTAYDPSQAKNPNRYENKKSIEILGIQYRSTEELTRGIMEDFKARGWL